MCNIPKCSTTGQRHQIIISKILATPINDQLVYKWLRKSYLLFENLSRTPPPPLPPPFKSTSENVLESVVIGKCLFVFRGFSHTLISLYYRCLVLMPPCLSPILTYLLICISKQQIFLLICISKFSYCEKILQK